MAPHRTAEGTLRNAHPCTDGGHVFWRNFSDTLAICTKMFKNVRHVSPVISFLIIISHGISREPTDVTGLTGQINLKCLRNKLIKGDSEVTSSHKILKPIFSCLSFLILKLSYNIYKVHQS